MDEACVTAQNYIIRVMFRWFRRAPDLPDAALAMVAPRAADAVLFLGASAAPLVGATSAVTRLNGRTVVLVRNAAEAAATERAAADAGGLLETVPAQPGPLPFESASFHLVVLPGFDRAPVSTRQPQLAGAARLLTPGGRLLVTTGEPRRGWKGQIGQPPARVSTDEVLNLLRTTGLAAVRKLAEADGVTYYEARRSR
jgi:SAM-dependent methyltransferase